MSAEEQLKEWILHGSKGRAQGMNQIKVAKRILILSATACAVIAQLALADSVSIRALDNGVDPFPESRFGSRPFRERESNSYRQTASDRAPSRSPSSYEFVPNRGDLREQVERFDSVEDRAPASVSVLPPSNEMRPGNARGVQEVAVIANELGFFPKTIFVNPDVPVRLYVTSSSKQSLCIILDSFQIRRQVKSMRIEEIAFTPSTPGKFRFYCPVNAMEGSIVVREVVQNVDREEPASVATGPASNGSAAN